MIINNILFYNLTHDDEKRNKSINKSLKRPKEKNPVKYWKEKNLKN